MKKIKLPKWLLTYAVLMVVALFGVTACSSWNDHRGKGDAPAGKGDDKPAHITNMPDGFPNGSAKCVAGFPPYAFIVTSDRTLLMFQAPAQCGGKVVEGSPSVVGN